MHDHSLALYLFQVPVSPMSFTIVSDSQLLERSNIFHLYLINTTQTLHNNIRTYRHITVLAKLQHIHGAPQKGSRQVFLSQIRQILTDFQVCGIGLDASVSRPSRGAVVPRLGLASELAYASASSRSRALKALVSVSPRLEVSMPRSRTRSRATRSRSQLKRPRAHPCRFSTCCDWQTQQ